MEHEGDNYTNRDRCFWTNYTKTGIDETQQNSRCILFGVKDKAINHIISEYIKIEYKNYKTRLDWGGGKIIQWKL